jgi:FkbM family methyltransferase
MKIFKLLLNKNPFVKSLVFRVHAIIFKKPYRYLNYAKGVIHVGANWGQEKDIYSYFNINVIWVEPIPEIFNKLKENIHRYPNQQAYQELVSEIDGQEVDFNVSTHDGTASSILDFQDHELLWPEISFEQKIRLKSITLPSLLKKYNVDISVYDFLVLDVQGAELLVLKGAQSILQQFRYIQLEAADFIMYRENATIKQISDLLSQIGFEEIARHTLAGEEVGKKCFEIFYKKR